MDRSALPLHTYSPGRQPEPLLSQNIDFQAEHSWASFYLAASSLRSLFGDLLSLYPHNQNNPSAPTLRLHARDEHPEADTDDSDCAHRDITVQR